MPRTGPKISTLIFADGSNYVACDGSKNVLKCADPTNAIICIETISSGISSRHICQMVPEGIPNKNCTSGDLKQHINGKCNGKKGKCILFKRITEFSKYCERAVKYIALYFKCGEYSTS